MRFFFAQLLQLFNNVSCRRDIFLVQMVKHKQWIIMFVIRLIFMLLCRCYCAFLTNIISIILFGLCFLCRGAAPRKSNKKPKHLKSKFVLTGLTAKWNEQPHINRLFYGCEMHTGANDRLEINKNLNKRSLGVHNDSMLFLYVTAVKGSLKHTHTQSNTERRCEWVW